MAQKKNLDYFFKPHEEKIVPFPVPPRFVDDDGNPIMFEAKTLAPEKIREINKAYRKSELLTGKNGSPYITAQNEAIFAVQKDNEKASRHIMIEALVTPNLKDPDLLERFKCADATDMPLKVFSTAEYNHVNDKLLEILGLVEPAKKEKEDFETIKKG